MKSITIKESTNMDAYENGMVEARVAFMNRIKDLVKLVNTNNLSFFLVYYMSLSAVVHESMAKFFKKAGKRCRKLGFKNLLDVFITQAQLETEQSDEIRNDMSVWINWWNDQKNLNLSLKDYQYHPMTLSMQVYLDLHKDIVKSKSPFAELAVEYEIQRMQMIQSVSFIKLVFLKLGGFSALRKLRFIRSAAKFNLNSPLNKKQLTAFLSTRPEALAIMIDKASSALLAYADFIEDCFNLAENEARKIQSIASVDIDIFPERSVIG